MGVSARGVVHDRIAITNNPTAAAGLPAPLPSGVDVRGPRLRGGSAQASARRTIIAAAEAMSCTDAHSRTEWYSWPPVNRFGVGRPIALSSEPSVPPRIGVRTTSSPSARIACSAVRDDLRERRRCGGACSSTARRTSTCRRARGSAATTSAAVRVSSATWRSSSSSSKSRRIARTTALARRRLHLVGVDEPLAPGGRLGRRACRRAARRGCAPPAARRSTSLPFAQPGWMSTPCTVSCHFDRAERLVLELAGLGAVERVGAARRRSARCRTASRPGRSPRRA